MAATRIQFVDKVGGSGHEHISFLGSDVKKWARRDMVTLIEKGEQFYTQDGYNKASIEVVTPPRGDKYVRTKRDGVWTDNLLALPPCPPGLSLVRLY